MDNIKNEVIAHLNDLNKILKRNVFTKELFEYNYRLNTVDLNSIDLNLFLVSLVKEKIDNDIKQINVGENIDKIKVVFFLNVILNDFGLDDIEVID